MNLLVFYLVVIGVDVEEFVFVCDIIFEVEFVD